MPAYDSENMASIEESPSRTCACKGLRAQGSGCRVQGAGFRVQGAGFRVQGSGCRIQGSTKAFVASAGKVVDQCIHHVTARLCPCLSTATGPGVKRLGSPS